MKKEIPEKLARRLINAGNVVLVSSGTELKKNVFTLAWSTPLSHSLPAYIGICVAKNHYSWELISVSGEFQLNIPDTTLLDKVLYCGKHSGRKIDKFQGAGLTPLPPVKLRYAPAISECVGHIECEVDDLKQVGDHTFFIGKVVFAQVEETIFNKTWDLSKVRLIHHFGEMLFACTSEILLE